MPLPDLNMPEDPNDSIPLEDPLRAKKERLQSIRRQNTSTGRQLEMQGVVVPIQQNLPMLQIQALLKFALETEEDRVDYEILLQESVAEMFANVEEQRGRAVLLQPHQTAGRKA